MNLKYYVVVFCTLFALKVSAGNDNFPIGARSWGMGNASVISADEWSPFNNVSLMAMQTQRSVGFAYENRFGFAALSSMASAFVLPTEKLGTFGLSFYRFGDKYYNEQKFALGYAFSIKDINIGGNVDFLQNGFDLSEQNDGIQSKNSIAFEFGISTKFTSKINFGASVYNFTRTTLLEYEHLDLKEKVPTLIRAGFSYKPLEKLTFQVETEKDLDYPANFKGGIEYFIIKQLALRTGVNSAPEMAFYGLGIRLKSMSIDYAVSNHPQLGLSHHASLSYKFGGSKE